MLRVFIDLVLSRLMLPRSKRQSKSPHKFARQFARKVACTATQNMRNRQLARPTATGQSTSGFTLTELLVAALIGALIVSGLLSIMVELLTTDARETARNETQREMQLALDYISSDLREAVYVYDGECIDGPSSSNPKAKDICSGLFNYIPVPANSAPILAFWKLDDLPEKVKAQCAANPFVEIGGKSVPCLSGRAYTLVVYFLTRNAGNPTWSGKARIQRYTLPRYEETTGNPVAGYVDPESEQGGFDNWPEEPNGSPPVNRAATLVDFVDDRAMNDIPELKEAGGASVQCPPEYALTPSNTTLNNYGFTDVRNFYACVRIPVQLQATTAANSTLQQQNNAFNQKVILFVRGNAAGKPGIESVNEGFMPAIATQVLNRGVRNKQPSQ